LGDGGMKRFVEGEDRLQVALLPHCLVHRFRISGSMSYAAVSI
jgi:hypothetical protein